MADARRRGYGEDGIYFDHRGDCRDSAHHKTCAGRWRGVVSLGFNTDGNRVRRKVSGKTKAEVRDALGPLFAVIGTIPLKDPTVQDVRTALLKMAAAHATRTIQKAHNCLTRAIRQAPGQDLVRGNVSALVDTPQR
ncbi:MAG: hypothetical protein QOH87_889, partial [Trebonia sp.]|nr:hypothetical protein [Trebonia sp.]